MNSWSRSSHFVPRFFIPFLYWNRPTRGDGRKLIANARRGERERGRGKEKERESEIDGGTVYRVLISWKERGTIRRGRFYSFWRNHPSSFPLFDNDRIIGTESEWFFLFFFRFLTKKICKNWSFDRANFNFNFKWKIKTTVARTCILNEIKQYFLNRQQRRAFDVLKYRIVLFYFILFLSTYTIPLFFCIQKIHKDNRINYLSILNDRFASRFERRHIRHCLSSVSLTHYSS